MIHSLQRLKELSKEYQRMRYPNTPDHALPERQYSDKTANGLTRSICDFLKFSGWQAERINTTGRVIDTREVVTDVIGRSKEIGSTTWIPSSGRRGSADISSTIKGRSVKIEVKIGKDRQSQHQKDYEREVKAAGGQYWLVRDFASFLKRYDDFMENN